MWRGLKVQDAVVGFLTSHPLCPPLPTLRQHQLFQVPSARAQSFSVGVCLHIPTNFSQASISYASPNLPPPDVESETWPNLTAAKNPPAAKARHKPRAQSRAPQPREPPDPTVRPLTTDMQFLDVATQPSMEINAGLPLKEAAKLKRTQEEMEETLTMGLPTQITTLHTSTIHANPRFNTTQSPSTSMPPGQTTPLTTSS